MGVEDDRGYAAQIIVNELATNAIEASSRGVLVQLSLSSRILIQVSDTSCMMISEPREIDPETICPEVEAASEGGRGLGVVAALSEKCGVVPNSGTPWRKTVWATLRA